MHIYNGLSYCNSNTVACGIVIITDSYIWTNSDKDNIRLLLNLPIGGVFIHKGERGKCYSKIFGCKACHTGKHKKGL